MTDNRQSETRAVAKVAVTTGGAVSAFVPNSLEEAWRLSTAMAASGMLPKAYGQDPNKVMIGILAGSELGLTPFVALQSIAVIGNNPSLWGDGMLALVEASGKMGDIEETDDGETATCRVVRVGRKTPIIRTFSNADAKKAGLAGKAGPWTQYTARMRQMRARGFALRDGFSDVLKGMKSAEEMRDMVAISGGTISDHRGPITAQQLIEQASGDEPETGRSDADHGDQHDGVDDAEVVDVEPDDDTASLEDHPARLIAAQMIAKIATVTTIVDLNSALDRTTIDAMPDDIAGPVRDAANAKREELKGGK